MFEYNSFKCRITGKYGKIAQHCFPFQQFLLSVVFPDDEEYQGSYCHASPKYQFILQNG